MVFRRAEVADTQRCWELIVEAKAFMKVDGRCQWDENYPTYDHVVNDIADGVAWVLCEDELPMAYAAVVFTGEPAYEHLKGEWLSIQPYVIVHRLCVADQAKGKGLAYRYFEETISLAKSLSVNSFKVDTNFDNAAMLHILKKMDFTYCGEIFYQQGVRLAFEKILK